MLGEFNIELSRRKHLQWAILCTVFGIQNGNSANWNSAIWNSAKW